jgi:putative sterol carrier protein
MPALFSQEWLDRFAEEIQKGPSPERLQKVDDNYWQWIERRKPDLNLRLALVIKEEPEQYAYLEFKNGELADWHLGTADERHTADFVLGGTREDWQEVLTGPRDLTQNIMYRRLRLFQGNLHAFFRGIYFFVETLRAGLRAPVEF